MSLARTNDISSTQIQRQKEIKELDLETKRNLKFGFNCHMVAP